MNSEWASLIPVAMIGTDRQAASTPTWPGDVGELAAQLLVREASDAATDAGTLATNVLRTAGAIATCSLAGAHGAPWPDPLPVGAMMDSVPAAERGPLLAHMRWAFHEGPGPLHAVVCAALARANQRLPYVLLPRALELGRRSIALRPLLSPVLGARGEWLASQQDDWRYAAGVTDEVTDDTRWTDGSLEQRVAFLMMERQADPAAGRERLAASLDELPAKERATFAGALAAQLSMEDEPLLERLRTDRSREVRQAALDLLLRLPSAAHVRRAIARLEPLLRQERVLIRRRWTIDAPDMAGPDWKDDNLDAVRPKHESLGERAWWLHQLVRQVPLAWWTQQTGMTAAELNLWAGETDWSEALWRGWRDVLLSAPDAVWCEALLERWPACLSQADRGAVLALLPAGARERHWIDELSRKADAFPSLVMQAIAVCPPGATLSAALSSTFVEHLLHRTLGRGVVGDYALRSLLPDLCATLHASVLDRLTAIPRHADETPAEVAVLNDVAQILAVRHALRTFTPSGTP